MNTRQLPYIIAIASTGSLSAASRRLGVSQPALSKYLKELEAGAGLELFFRDGKRYLPTPAGRLYIRAAQRILELGRHAQSSIAALDAAPTAALCLGLSPNRGMAILAKVYPELDQRYPQLQLTLREGYSHRLQELLLQNELDAAITTHMGPVPEGLNILPFHTVEMVLAVPSFHPLAGHGASTLEALPYADLHDFRDAVFIMPAPSSTLYTIAQSIFFSAGFQPQVTTSSPNILIQEAMIRSGSRVGLLPSFYVRPDPDISFFRLKNPAKLVMTYITRTGHVYTAVERYLLYLILDHELKDSTSTILWSAPLRAFLWEFDPARAAGMRLEAPL